MLVDVLHGAAQLAAEPLARAQIEAADRLIITKPDWVLPKALARLAATLNALTPTAQVSAAEQGLPIPLPDLNVPPLVLPELAGILVGVTPIRPYRLNIGAEGGWVALSTWFLALLLSRGDDVVRIKGVLRTPAGLLLLQSVRRVVQPPEILPDDNTGLVGPSPQEGMIVLLGSNINEDRLKRSWEIFGA